jgi:hypothetical protein
VQALGGGVVYTYLADPDKGLPAPDSVFPSKDYKAKIGLEYLGPPSFGIGTGGYYGTQLVGGVSAFFGDMLGDHFLATALQANGRIKDIGGQALYMNATHRLNWGASVGHIPYQLPYYPSFTPRPDGTWEYQQVIDRVTVDQASGLSYYPLSTTRRFELNAGLARYSFSREVQRFFTNSFGQQISQVEIFDTTVADPLNLFQGSAAFVGDNANFGFTSPVSGKRFRFEVAPTLGTLDYNTFTADYRQYSFFNPFTLAFRLMHYGRYGRNADGITDDNLRVLSPLFLGYESIVRGYAYESIESSECGTGNGCPVWDRLLGTRMAVANLEFRIPLIGVPDFGLLKFAFLPTEIAPFIDAGVAWTADESPDLVFARRSEKRIPVVSAGIAARVNVLGFMILETYYAYPFQRPDKGWHLGFNLMPGW